MPAQTSVQVALFGLLIASTIGTAPSARGELTDQPMRVWTDVDGRTINAVLVAVEGDSVKLNKDGKVYTVPLARLSERDRAYAQAAARDSQPQPAVGPTGIPTAMIDAIRKRPWDDKPLLKLAEWLDSRDPPRAELVRVQLKLAPLHFGDPERDQLYSRRKQLLSENEQRWTEPLGDLAAGARIAFGLIDSLKIKEATDDQIARLKDFPELRRLSLSSPKISDKGFALIASLPNLDSLTIQGGNVSEQALAHLEKLPPWTVIRLYVDDLDSQQVDAMNQRRVAPFKQFTPEEKRDAAARYLAGVNGVRPQGKPPLDAQLGQSGVKDPEMLLLSGLPELETVYIAESDVTAKGIAHLAGLKNLKDLGLWDTYVESIASLAGLTNIEKLGIFPSYGTEMGDAGMAALENFTRLQELYLNDDAISDATIKRLAGLTRLRKLDLTVGKLNDEDSLSALAGLKDLEELSFHGVGVSDAALAHLAGLAKLDALNIRVERGNGEGLKHLAGLNKLTLASLSGKGVTDHGIGQLAGLKGLQTIMAQGSAVFKEGAEQLAAELPHVTIILDDCVVKSPRDSYKLRRQRVGNTVSLLLPADWLNGQKASNTYLQVSEDDWNRIGSWSGKFVGPVEICMYWSKESKSAKEGMMESVDNNSHLNPKILQQDVQAIGGAKDTASCIYQNDHNKYLVSTAQTEKGTLVLYFEGPPSRFAEYEPLFRAVVRSVRISDDPTRHAEETIEVPVAKLAEF